jgi:N6-L-threonylcarbamoyladenine synthase
MEVIGETMDDAVGEAFDKSAKILGLPYPGGPLIDKYAAAGDPKAFSFPKPKAGPLSFSFSGLKTAVLYFVRDRQKEDPGFVENNIADICASLQATIVDYLMDKLSNAVEQTGIKEVAIGGGVSANSGIRRALEQAEIDRGWRTHIPKFEYCTDNAAMIAMVGEIKYKAGQYADNSVAAAARMPF